MRCPYCLEAETAVLESRIADGGRALRRRRVCGKCDRRFTTYERVEGIDVRIIKKSGAAEKFDREKIKKGILKATWRRPLSVDKIEEMIDSVERELRERESEEVKSYDVGELVLKELRAVDPIGAFSFAIVYRDIDTISEFEKELGKLKIATQ
jgi:transcriptional repressor NrdR